MLDVKNVIVVSGVLQIKESSSSIVLQKFELDHVFKNILKNLLIFTLI
jgi:hypothetical protein